MNSKMFAQMAQGMGMSLEDVEKLIELRTELRRILFSPITEYGTVPSFTEQNMGNGKKELKRLGKHIRTKDCDGKY